MKTKTRLRFMTVFLAMVVGLTAGAFAENDKPIVTGLRAEALSPREIRIDWKLPEYSDVSNPLVGLNIYRSTQPIRTPKSLGMETLLATVPPDTESYVDIISNDTIFYYAVIAITRNFSYNLVVSSVNSTVNGITSSRRETAEQRTASAADKPVKGMRNVPVPALGLSTLPGARNTMDSDAVNSAVTLAEKRPPAVLMKPHVFERELLADSPDEPKTLYTIVSGTFAQKKYAEARKQLEEFLQVTRSPDQKVRARFYLGECLYYLGEYRLAITSFMDVKSAYPDLTSRWITASLDLVW